MQKILIPLLCFLLSITLVAAANDHLIINQVLYLPTSTTDGEAVELFNPTTISINLSGYTLATKTSLKDVTLPSVIVAPNAFFLVTDPNWNQTKQPEWPFADYEETMTLTNTNSGVALQLQNKTIDSAGWGNSSGFEETTPTEGTIPGESLQRKNNQDTDNNLNDFFPALPSFKIKTIIQENNSIPTIDFSVNISQEETTLNVSLEDDDGGEAGVQIIPLPGKQKKLVLSGIPNSTDLIYMLRFPNQSQEERAFDALSLASSDPAGEYTLSILKQNQTLEELPFTYKELTAFNMSTTKMEFGAVKINQNKTASIFFTNQGNTPLTLGFYLRDVNTTFFDQKIKITLNQTAGMLGKKPIYLKNEINPGETAEVSFEFRVNETTISGIYWGKIGVLTQA